MGSIPPVSPTPPNFPSQPEGPSGQAIYNKLESFIEQYRTAMQEYMDQPSPKDPRAVEAVMEKIKKYLEKHEAAIEKLSPTCGQFLNSTISSINNFIEDPNPGSLDMVNEQLTQLHWLIGNEN
ncbi:MAG: hypothetical protein HYX48_00630 [Chlamydiales bacterium]|nr:hypothetical protein [Chlamydiales bacterium]